MRTSTSGRIPSLEPSARSCGTNCFPSGGFSAKFLEVPEPPAGEVLLAEGSVAAFAARLVEMARPRLDFLARQDDSWWLATRPFFDVNRQRIWIFWRRILDSAHHRTQLTVY
jgi:hypothetical protein